MEEDEDSNQATDTRGPVLHNPFYHQLPLGEVGRLCMPTSSISGRSGHLEDDVEERSRERRVGGS